MRNWPKKVVILYSDVDRAHFATEELYLTEKDAKKDALIIAKYFPELGIKVSTLSANENFPAVLKKEKPDLVFNLVGSVRGQDRLASTIPAILDFLQIPYAGAGFFGETIVYNKYLVLKLLEQAQVPVPQSQLFTGETDRLDNSIKFPVISKLNEIHGGVEMNESAISASHKALKTRIQKLAKLYRQPILVQQFIKGREITAIVLEGKKTNVYLAEKIFDLKNSDGMKFATFQGQWMDDSQESFSYKKFHDKKLENFVKKAFDTCQMGSYGKFDIRLTKEGNCYFIDSNTNPAFGPKESHCAISTILDLYGISFPEILKEIIVGVSQKFSIVF